MALKHFALGGVAVAAVALWTLHQISWGLLGEHEGPGEIRGEAVPQKLISKRESARGARAAALGVPRGRQILFGDLHVHTTFSTDAFASSLPILGGSGAHPPADACDFARYCSGLDFWSVNDHASNLTPEHWRETQQSILECNARSGDPERPDLVSFLGWEWTQVGQTAETHYGHKNVVLLETASERVPARPIAEPVALAVGGAAGPGALALLDLDRSPQRYFDFARYMKDRGEVPYCAENVDTRELPEECREVAETPAVLFRKLREWGGESIVIPHGTSWGFYAPLGGSWDKQLGTDQDDPQRQTLFEVYSGHGNAEEYRDWRAVETNADGSPHCPAPRPDYLPSCWQAGEIMRERCLAAGEASDECEQRAALTRQRYVDIGTRGFQVVPGQRPDDWLDAGQCRDCFLPAFNHRPGNSAQYAAAISHFDPTNPDAPPKRARFGFIAASDGHQAKPGIGYKQINRDFFVDGLKFETPEALDTVLGRGGDRTESRPLAADNFGGFGTFEVERTTSFLSAGGLTAVHASGRDRQSIWDALKRREVYGTSGTKILLWFDLLNPPSPHAHNADRSAPMGSELAMTDAPRFRVRASGSFVQQPGCPDYAVYALGPDRIGALCADECDFPGEQRRRIDRIEVIRIRPQQTPGEPVAPLIEDPWRVFNCPVDPSGCVVEFDDRAFARDSVYYVRAVEEPTPVINAGGLRCTLDEAGECIAVDACHQNFETDPADDCLGEASERAWSSPIYIDFAEAVGGSSVEPEPTREHPPSRANRLSMVALPEAD